MRYFGGKQRIAADILAVIEKYRTGLHQLFFEPFLGGANIITRVSGYRAAADLNSDLIIMYKALQNGWDPPRSLSIVEYEAAKRIPTGTDPVKAFAGFGCSFAGKWFGGYAKSAGRDYVSNARNSLLRKRDGLLGVSLFAKPYTAFNPVGALIYCDPPYQGTTQYGAVGNFDSCMFWGVMREWAKKNTVLVSEYSAPNNCQVIWEKPVVLDIRGKLGKISKIEKLFLVH